jgi:hypothetical protein
VTDVHARIYAAELGLMGLLAILSVFLPLEAAVFAGGPMLAFVALLYASSKGLRRQHGFAVAFGAAGIVLGVFVGATAILVHLCIAICILGLAAFQAMLTFAAPRSVV